MKYRLANGPSAGQYVEMEDPQDMVVKTMLIANGGMGCEHMPAKFSGPQINQFMVEYRFDEKLQMFTTNVDWAYATYLCRECEDEKDVRLRTEDYIEERVKERIASVRENIIAALDGLGKDDWHDYI
jgi:hypothetical protein